MQSLLWADALAQRALVEFFQRPHRAPVATNALAVSRDGKQSGYRLKSDSCNSATVLVPSRNAPSRKACDSPLRDTRGTDPGASGVFEEKTGGTQWFRLVISPFAFFPAETPKNAPDISRRRLYRLACLGGALAPLTLPDIQRVPDADAS